MTVLALLLLFDAALHGLVILRFGLGDRDGIPFLVFAVAYLVLAIAVFLAWRYALWATLILATVGIVGLTTTFRNARRDKTIDKVIWAVDALIIAGAVYLLSVAGEAPPTP